MEPHSTDTTLPAAGTATPELVASLRRALQVERAARRELEAEIAARMEVSRAARRAASISIWRFELAEGRASDDGILQDMLGYPAEELRTREEWRRAAHPDDLPRIDQLWDDCVSGRIPRYELDYRLRHRDGRVLWFETRATSLRDTQGRIIGVAGVTQEITAQKRADEELRRAIRYNRQLLDLTPDPILVLDAGGSVVDVNPAAERLTGRRRAELLGQPFAGLFSDPAAAATVCRLTFAEGRVTDFALEFAAAGAPVPVLCSTASLPEDEGLRGGIIAVVRDVSSHAQAEITRRELELRVRETQKLESLGVLAGGIAHDFNNLLTGILGNASLARLETAPDGPVAHCLGEIEQAAQRAAELCRQMLAYSGKGRFVVQPLDLSELIAESMPLLELSVGKRVRLKTYLNKALPTVLADANQVRQVVMSLVVNAAEAIGDKDGQIRVTTGALRATGTYLATTHLAPELPDGTYAFFEVADNGCGIAPEMLPRIFDPFFTTKFTGRGLGLAAVLGIVRGHSGAIKVDSQPGRGTTFLVLLPATDRAAPVPPAAPEPAAAGDDTQRILVVDDEPSVRSVLTRLLRTLGYEVVTAENGQRALEMLHEGTDEIRAVLLDLTMPEMDGAETFRQLHRLQPSLPVVLMSGYSEQEAIARFTERGLAGFLQKPFSPDALKRRLDEALGVAPKPSAGSPDGSR